MSLVPQARRMLMIRAAVAYLVIMLIVVLSVLNEIKPARTSP